MPLNWEDYTCSGCGLGHDKPTPAAGLVEERYSLGIYAGRYHDNCWSKSGYRKEGREGFDPADAGEAYEAEDY